MYPIANDWKEHEISVFAFTNSLISFVTKIEFQFIVIFFICKYPNTKIHCS